MRILTARADAYWAKGGAGHALADYDQIVRLQPNSPDAYFERLNFLINTGDKDGALADIDQIVQLCPKDSGPYFFRAVMAWLFRGDRVRALADLDRAAALVPSSPYYALRGFLNAREFKLVPTGRDLALVVLMSRYTEFTFVGGIDFQQRRWTIGVTWGIKGEPGAPKAEQHASGIDAKCVDMGVQHLLAATLGASG